MWAGGDVIGGTEWGRERMRKGEEGGEGRTRRGGDVKWRQEG